MARLVAALVFCMVFQPAYADDCTAAAYRVIGFLKEEAKGTRHEAQISEAIQKNGEGPMVGQIASTLSSDECAFLLLAPDSTVRALAASMLPERNGE